MDKYDRADECFKENSDIHDHADGLHQIFDMVVDGLVKDKDDRKIARLVAFIFINFPNYVSMSDDGVLDLKNADPSIPLFDEEDLDLTIQQFDSLEIVEKCHLMTFMLNTIILDIVRSKDEKKLMEVGNTIHLLCKEAIDNMKSRETPSPEDLEKLWK